VKTDEILISLFLSLFLFIDRRLHKIRAGMNGEKREKKKKKKSREKKEMYRRVIDEDR
jgi:hypothetical protein